MMNPGDVVYFKKAKKSSERKDLEVGFRGHGFGVMLGHVDAFTPDPTTDQVIGLLGGIGFVSFDDISEFLGEGHAAVVIKKFEAKYLKAPVTAPKAAPETMPANLVNINGLPIIAEDANEVST